jgi:hypothetical protein
MEMTLYHISDEQRRLNAMLEENGGEVTPEIEEALAVNETNFVQKAESYGYAILHYKAIVAAVKAEKDRLDAIKKTAENAIARMEERIVAAMQQFDRPKVEADTLKLSLRRSERVVVDDEAKVPADCKTIKVEVSKTELKRHLKAGEDCGAHLEENQSLQIK